MHIFRMPACVHTPGVNLDVDRQDGSDISRMSVNLVQVVVNDDLEQGFKQLKAAISRFRPDLIPPAEDDAAAQAARKAAANNQPVPLVVLGPSGAHAALGQQFINVLSALC